MTRRSSFPAMLLLCSIAVLFSGCTKGLRQSRHLRRAAQDMKQGDYDTAEIEYRAALSLDSNDSITIGRMGVLFYREGRLAPSYLLLQQARKGGENDPEIELARGLASLDLARNSEARAIAKSLLEASPKDEQALLLLAEAALTTRDVKEALDLMDKLRAENGDAPGYHVGKGVLLADRHQWKEAETEFKQALQLEPDSVPALAGLGSVALSQRDRKTAETYLRQAAEKSPLRSPYRLRWIDFLIRTSRSALARKELATINHDAPDYIPAWNVAMQLAAGDHRDDEAVEDAGRILARDPMNFDALSRRAGVRLTQGNADSAIADLKVAQGFYPRAPLVKYQLARALLKKGDGAAAEDALHQALILSPRFDEAIQLLAQLKVEKSDSDAAVALIVPYLKRHPNDWRVILLLAQAYRQRGDLPQALALFQQIEVASPKSSAAPYLVGMARLESGDPAGARVEFEKSAAIADDYWPAEEILVNLDLSQHKPDDALKRMDAVAARYPKAADPLVFRARVKLAKGDAPGAEQDLQAAIALDPNSQYAYFELARIYLGWKNPRDAIARLADVARGSPNVAALMQLGMIHGQIGEASEARAAYERALALDPKFVPALNNLAFLYAGALHDPGKAQSLARQARQLAPDNPIVADTLGWVLFQQDNVAAAFPFLRQAGSALPTDPEVQYHFGRASYRLGHEADAIRSLQLAGAALPDPKLRDDANRRLTLLRLHPRADRSALGRLEAETRENQHDPVLLVRFAEACVAGGRSADAVTALEAALKLAPESLRGSLDLARLYAGQPERGSRVHDLINAARRLQPNDAGLAWTEGNILRAAGDATGAVDLLQQAARDLASRPELQFDLSLALYATGNVADAGTALQQALASQATFERRAEAERLSRLFAAADDPANAAGELAEAKAALASDPASVPALMVLAAVAEKAGDFQTARTSYEKIQQQNPKFPPALRRLAVLYALQFGDDAKAEAFALKARPSYSGDPAISFVLGAVYYRKGDFRSAVRYLQDSLRASDANGEALFYLGMAHFQLKNSTEARDELQRAIDLKLPVEESEEARRVLEEISRMGGVLGG